MRRECRERFPTPPLVRDPDIHHGTCVTLTSSFLWSRWRGKMFPAFPAHAQPVILRIWQEAHAQGRSMSLRHHCSLFLHPLCQPQVGLTMHIRLRAMNTHQYVCPPQHAYNHRRAKFSAGTKVYMNICIFNDMMPISSGHHDSYSFPPLDKMTAISRSIILDAFLWMKRFLFWSKCHRSLFLRFQLTSTWISLV